MSDAFDPSATYQLLGQSVVHLPLSGGEVTGLAVLDAPKLLPFNGDVVAIDPTLRFLTGTFSVQTGDSFVIGSQVWKVIAPPSPLYDGSESVASVVRVSS